MKHSEVCVGGGVFVIRTPHCKVSGCGILSEDWRMSRSPVQ